MGPVASVHQDRLAERACRLRTVCFRESAAELADEAAAHATRIAIEAMPFSAIATVPMGVDIITAAAHPAVGLLIDAWHVFRADTYAGHAQCGAAPGTHIRRRAERRRTHGGRHTVRGTVDRRLLCSEGSFDLAPRV